jgi:serine/threonine protein kinase
VERWETSPDLPKGLRGVGKGSDWRIGSVVDKYTIVRVLGRGGMGAVYEARHKLSRRFAIKFLHPELAANREMLRRFENEAKAAGGLEHANLAAVIDSGLAADGAPYLVMEYLEGEDCASLLRRLGPLPVQRAADIVFQACRGLAVAHRARIVHRDLKPENLFLVDAGDGSDLVKVLDFGIAKLRSNSGSLVTRMGEALGTPHYMSPEQARGASEVDERTDVWSLGVVLYELLSGRKPFKAVHFMHGLQEILNSDPPRLRRLRRGLPARLVTVVERAMAKDLEGRLPTVAALAEALGPFAGRESSIKVRRATPRLPTLLGPAAGLRTKREAARILGAIPPVSSRSAAILSLAVGAVVAAVTVTAVLKGRSSRQSEPVKDTTALVARGLVPRAPAPTSSDDESARKYLEVAETLTREERFEPAREVLDEANKLQIKSAELNIRIARLSEAVAMGALLKKATSLLENKDWRGAIDASKAALDRDSENPEALKVLTLAQAGLQPALAEHTGRARGPANAGTLSVSRAMSIELMPSSIPASPAKGPPAMTGEPPSPERSTPPPVSAPPTPAVARPAPPLAAATTQPRGSGPVLSAMPRSPVPKPTLPRDTYAENAEEVSRVCQLVEAAAVSLGGVSPEFARGITGPLRRSLEGGGELYGIAMYYFIIREASLQHDSKTAAENLVAAHSKGFLLQLKNLPGNDQGL